MTYRYTLHSTGPKCSTVINNKPIYNYDMRVCVLHNLELEIKVCKKVSLLFKFENLHMSFPILLDIKT